MFVILVYDAEAKRDPKILKLCRRYLTWVQNSVFEGNITDSKYRMMMSEIKDIINTDTDSVITYQLRSTSYSKRETLGIRKGEEDNFI